MALNTLFFVLVIVTGLATLGSLIAGLVTMSRVLPDRGRDGNMFMWWRVRLQALTLVWVLLWWATKNLEREPWRVARSPLRPRSRQTGQQREFPDQGSGSERTGCGLSLHCTPSIECRSRVGGLHLTTDHAPTADCPFKRARRPRQSTAIPTTRFFRDPLIEPQITGVPCVS